MKVSTRRSLRLGSGQLYSLYNLELRYQVAIDGAASLQIKTYPVHSIKTCIRVPEHQQL